MKKSYNFFKGNYMAGFKSIFLLSAFCFMGKMGCGQSYQSFDGSVATNVWTSSLWSAPSATNACVVAGANMHTTGSIVYLCTPAGKGTGAVGITIKGIIATEDYTHIVPSGTLSTGGSVVAIDVAAGKTVDLGNMAISTAAGTGFNKVNTGTLISATMGAYTGGFTLSAGTIIIKSVNAMGGNLGALNINGGVLAASGSQTITSRYSGINIGGDFTLGNAAYIGNISFADPISLGTGFNRTITLGSPDTYTFSGIISGAGSGLTLAATEAGTLILSGTNTYNAATTIKGGTLSVATIGDAGFAGNLGQATNAATNFVLGGGTLLYTGIAASSDRNFTLTNGTTSTISNENTLTLNGSAGGSTGSLIKAGSGTLVFGGSNQYTGATAISAKGTIQLGAAERINDASALTVASSASFDMNGFSETVGSLAGAGAVISSVVGTSTLTTGGDNTSTTFQGIIQNGSGTVALIKAGTGTLTLTGANTYTGITTVNAGTLQLNKTGGATISGAQIVNVNIGGTLKVSQSQTLTNITLAAGSTLTVDSGKILTITGTLTVNTASTINGSGVIAYSGTGALVYNGAASRTTSIEWLTFSGPNTVNVNALATVVLSANASTNALTVDGTLNAVTYTISSINTVVLNSTGKVITASIHGFSGGGGSTFNTPAFTLNAGCTVELNRNDGVAQDLAGRADFKNLTFSGSGTKTISSGFNPDGTVYITGSAILDIGFSNGFGDATTNLTMDGGRFKMAGSSSSKPDIDGTFNLIAGVIEFAGSAVGTTQPIKGRTAFGRDIIYKNIEVTGTNVGTSSNNIYLSKTGGNFTVKTNAVYGPKIFSIISENAVNTSSVTVENGAFFKTGNNQGFSGTAYAVGNNSSIDNNIKALYISLNSGSTIDYIGSGAQLISNQIPYQNLAISASAGIKTAPSGILAIQGNLTKTGTSTFAHNGGTVLFSGGAAQSYGVNNTMALPIMAFYNVTNSNPANLNINDSMAIVNLLSLPDGSKLNLTTGDIILKSSSAATAAVDKIGTGAIAYGTGRFIAERYINNAGHSKAWQFLAVPLSSTQSIKDAFQEGGSLGNNPKPGFGTQLTNPASTGAGYDASTLGTSIKTYISASDQWDAGPSNTTNSINNSKGWMTFIRGDRGLAANFTGSGTSSTILRTRGQLLTGNQGPFNVANGKYEAVGNPYTSAIDLTQTTRTNLANEIYVWDPTLGTGGGGGNYGVGRYRVLTLVGSNYEVAPSGGAYPNAVNNTIQSGQAFFIKGAAGGSSISFSENSKVGSSILVNGGPVANPAAVLSVNLSAKLSGSPDELLDGGIAIFDKGYADEVDEQDGTKLMNAGENVGFRRGISFLTVERRSLPKITDTLNLEISGMKQQGYTFDFNADAFTLPNVNAYLWDNYTKLYSPISGASTWVNFSVDPNTASAAAGRFKIVFAMPNAGPLPVTLTKISASRTPDNTIRVNWQTTNELNLQQYTIERSSNGSSFETVGMQSALNNSGGGSNYIFNDANPLATDNYYRIKSVSKDGSIQYSPVVKVAALNLATSISVYPNPVVERHMAITFTNQAAGKYSLLLTNKAGQAVYRGIVTVSGNSFAKPIYLLPGIAAGIYQLTITDANGKTTVQQLIVL
jgi:autotransporter-associated beta strand protein